MAVGIVEDIVVDLTLELDRSVDAEALARGLVLPGMEILRSASGGTVWLTVLLAADSEANAVRQMRETVLAQIPHEVRLGQATVVTSAPLGVLHARLDAVDDDPESITLRDLVEAHLWDRDEHAARSAGATGRRRVS